MELHEEEEEFLEELLALRRGTEWEMDHSLRPSHELILTGAGRVNCSREIPSMVTQSCPELKDLVLAADRSFDCLSEIYQPSAATVSAVAASELHPSTMSKGYGAWMEFRCQNWCQAAPADEGLGSIQEENDHGHHFHGAEPALHCSTLEGTEGSQIKRTESFASKNLMAERRRRKRLNDRLAMLRSVVPKISKMDRTSILGDTIDYVKELLEKINALQEKIPSDSDQADNVSGLEPKSMSPRNSPKFDVERREGDARIEIRCGNKPGLLLSMLSTMDNMGFEVQQCVASCFGDFVMQASCSEDKEQRTVVTSDEMKQALFRTAGYGGKLALEEER